MLQEDAVVPEIKPNGRTPAAQALRTDQVIRAALRLAAKGGYDAVQMREVARIANVALATLYRYYPSKDELIAAMVDSQLSSLRADLQRRPARQRSAGERAAEAFVRSFHAMRHSPGLAHAALSVLQAPKPFASDQEGRSGGGATRTFVGMAAEQAWGPERTPTAAEYRALCMIETVWVGSTVSWLNGDLTAEEVETRLRLAARKLLS